MTRWAAERIPGAKLHLSVHLFLTLLFENKEVIGPYFIIFKQQDRKQVDNLYCKTLKIPLSGALNTLHSPNFDGALLNWATQF